MYWCSIFLTGEWANVDFTYAGSRLCIFYATFPNVGLVQLRADRDVRKESIVKGIRIFNGQSTKGCTRVLRSLVCSLAGVCLFACLSVCVCHEMNGLRGSSLSVPKRVSQV